MDHELPREGEELPHHVQAREIGAVLDATVLLPFSMGLAWMTAFTSPAKKDAEPKGF